MRWESQEERRRAAMEKHVIAGKVRLCPEYPFPFDQLSASPVNAPSPHSVFPLSLLNSPDSSSSLSSVQSQSRLMSALYWLCGMERRKEGENVTPPAPEQPICSLEEKPCLRRIVNTNLIICISVTAFIIGYWG